MNCDISANMSRRGLLKGGAVLAASAALASLVGCAPKTREDRWEETRPRTSTTSSLPGSWDMEADVVAIGGGGAGLAAGIEARDLGMSAIVLESESMTGGNSAICNGGMAIPGSALQQQLGIEDSPEAMYEDMIRHFGHDYYDDYVRLMCEECSKLYDWLTGFGIQFREESLLATNGHSRRREHHLAPGDAMRTLNQVALDKGVQIKTDTKVVQLLREESGRVVGCRTEQGAYVKANRGVVLATGGYARNTDMINQFVLGEGAEAYAKTTYDAIGQDGSGIRMAQAIGVDTRHMDYCSMLTVQNPDGDNGAACAIYHLGAVLVNESGERFVNEAQGYTNVWTETNMQPNRVCFQVWDQAIYDEYRSNDSSYYSMDKVENTGLLLRADTYEEFVATMERYNSDVGTSGVDSVMGRAHLNNDGPSPLVLNHAPYYAFKTTNVICTTYGGLRQDASQGCLAVDVFGDVVPGLYLAGNVSGYSNMGCNPGTRIARNASGTGFGGALAFGRYCAAQIAQQGN